MTGRIYQSSRPVNMCFIKTQFDFPLVNMEESFTAIQRCDLAYFLHLPNSLVADVVS